MSKKRTNYMHRATQLTSKLVRDRDRVCLAAGFDGRECKGVLQACHIIGRDEHCIRTDFDNVVSMCASHHKYYTHNPGQWLNFVEERWPGRLDELRLRVRVHRESNGKVDWRHRYETLKALADSLGVS